jgi:DNA-binding response OmpR family regulator
VSPPSRHPPPGGSKEAPPAPKPASPAKPSIALRPDAPVVLVVEDDDDLRRLIVTGLGVAFRVYEARDGQHALEVLETMPVPAAIVSDVNMPRVDGFSLAKLLKREPQRKSIPLVFLTARTRPIDVVTGINAGARHYITKPFKVADLVAKVQSVIAKDKR